MWSTLLRQYKPKYQAKGTAQNKNSNSLTANKLEGLLARCLVIGISSDSRFMHRYSPNNAITASPEILTTHQVKDEGQPP